MNKEKLVRSLTVAAQEHKIRNKPGEVAIYDALVYIVEKLDRIEKLVKKEV